MANYRSLIGFEYKKLLKRKIVWIMVVVMMILCILTACINCLGNFYVEGELFETHYEKIQKEHNFARNLSGRTIDDELLQEMWDSYAKVEETEVNQWLTESYQQYGRPYNSVLFFLMEMTGKDNVENMSAAQAYALRKQQQEQEWKKYYLTDGEKDYLAEMDNEGATPLVFAYGDGYECICAMLQVVGIFMTLLVCMMFNIPNAYRVISQIYSYLPFRAISVGNVFGPRLVPVFCSYWAAWQIIPVIYGVAAVALWLLGKWQYEHYEISSR